MLRRVAIAWIAAQFVLSAGAAPAGRGAASLPLFFFENRGQTHADVRFVAHGSGLTAFFTSGEAVFRIARSAVRMQFVGARPDVQLEGVDPLQATANFFVGAEEEWRTGVPLYCAVRYRDLYPGIDMVYGGNGRNLKSEFVVAPGADPALIRFRYAGADRPRIDDSGALVVPVAGSDLREEAPVIYQERSGARVAVNGRFVVDADGTVSFGVNAWDRSLPLVIDPTLSYSTLLGGSNADAALAMAAGSTGAAYIAGYTASTNFPTANPEQNFNAGGNEVFVAKLSAAGSSLVYCTYIGGRSDDRAYAIAVDQSGAAYVAGSTTSSNFPLHGALQSKLAGARNAFVLKLNTAGNTLVFSTYFGGNASDTAYGIAVDSYGYSYITGDSTSITLPTTGLQRGNHGGQDAFVAKIAADGSRVMYATYLGGSLDDHAAAIAVNTNGEAYITGSTWSSDFPTAAAYQANPGGGQDAFVARINTAGTALLFSTYLGGTGGGIGYPESGQAIALDSQGSAYVAGVTSSANFPLLNAFQTTRLGATDAFVAKLTSAGVLAYSSYLGGTGPDAANAIAVDSSGCAYVAGQTLSSDLSVTNAQQSASGGDYDAFWARLSAAGDALQILSYLGGNGSDTATSVALDGSGGVYIAGWTLSTNFPLLNGYQTINSGNYGAFITRFSVAGGPPQVVSVSPASGSGTSQTFTIVYSDLSGYQAIVSSMTLINSTLSGANGCWVLFSAANNAVYLTNDAGSAWQNPVTLGNSGTVENSQCSLSGAGSSLSGSGANLTLNLALSFKSPFAGAKYVYGEVYDGSGDSGWQQKGTWTVPSGPSLQVVSVTPASGSGTTQTFAFVYSDTDGYQSIVSSMIVINSTMSGANGCWLRYIQSENAIYLTNDAATAWQTPVTLGQSGTLQNSQCSVNPASSSASGSGTTLTLNVSITFATAFSGAKNIYAEVYAGPQADSGWSQVGSWTVPSSGLPQVLSVTPSSGSGTSQVFAFQYADPNGYQAIVSSLILINSTLSGTNACWLYFIPSTKAIYLTNDAGSAWQAPVTLGQSGTLENSQCSVNTAASSSSGSGTGLTLSLSLTFKSTFNGPKNIYAEVYAGTGTDSGWSQAGSWTVPSGGLPQVLSVTPSTGIGTSQVFTFQYSDPNGYQAIASSLILFNLTLSVMNGCYMLYYRPTNSLYLTNDEGTAWQSPLPLTQSGTLQNSQCSIDLSASSASGSGNNLSVTLSITFKASGAGMRQIYAEVYEGPADSGWQLLGSWVG